jgi:DNA topoisomerase-3
LEPLLAAQTQNPRWGTFAAQVVQRGANPRNGHKTDGAHPPIHPLKPMDGNPEGNELQLYELIVRHFLATCSWDARGDETTVSIECGGEQFTASGLMIIDRGYLDVYPYDEWKARQSKIGVYQQGQSFEPSRVDVRASWTQPPTLLTEADLITLMDKHGIGTDATHAEHINTIKERGYVCEMNDRRIVPSYLGVALVDGYAMIEKAMSEPQLRAELEADLKRVCAGELDKTIALRKHVDEYRRIFVLAERNVQHLANALRSYFDTGVKICARAAHARYAGARADDALPVAGVRRGADNDDAPNGDNDDDEDNQPPAGGGRARGAAAAGLIHSVLRSRIARVCSRCE